MSLEPSQILLVLLLAVSPNYNGAVVWGLAYFLVVVLVAKSNLTVGIFMCFLSAAQNEVLNSRALDLWMVSDLGILVPPL